YWEPRVLPAAGLQEFLFVDGGGGKALHGTSHLLADFGKDLGIVEVGGGDDDGLGAGDRFGPLLGIVFHVERGGTLLHEDARANEDSLGAQLHHEGRVGGGCDAAGGEVGDGQLSGLRHHADEFVGGLMFLGGGVEFLLTEDGKGFHFLDDLAHVLDGVDHVAGAGLALGADHGRAFRDAAEGFTEVARSADEGRGEGVLVDVVRLVGRGEHFALVDEVDAELLKDLGLGEVPDAGLGHDRNGNGLDDPLDEFGIGHAGYAALGADHGGHAFERHD